MLLLLLLFVLQIELKEMQQEIRSATFVSVRAAEEQSAQLKRLMDQSRVDASKTQEMLSQVGQLHTVCVCVCLCLTECVSQFLWSAVPKQSQATVQQVWCRHNLYKSKHCIFVAMMFVTGTFLLC